MLYDPAKQFWQAPPSTLSWYFPATQSTHSVRASLACWPCEQSKIVGRIQAELIQLEILEYHSYVRGNYADFIYSLSAINCSECALRAVMSAKRRRITSITDHVLIILPILYSPTHRCRACGFGNSSFVTFLTCIFLCLISVVSLLTRLTRCLARAWLLSASLPERGTVVRGDHLTL